MLPTNYCFLVYLTVVLVFEGQWYIFVEFLKVESTDCIDEIVANWKGD